MGRGNIRILFGIVVVASIGGLAFLYVWLNSKEILLSRERSELLVRILELERRILELEHRLEEATSPEALEEWLEQWNSQRMREGKPTMKPLPPERIVEIELDVEGEGG